MSETTNIQWCDSTFNPWVGCTQVSAGCAHCYIVRTAPARVNHVELGHGKPRYRVKTFRSQALALNRQAEREGRRIRVFPSLCDWLDAEVPIEWLAEFLDVMRLTPWLDWQLPTKRPELFRARLAAVLALLHGPCDLDIAMLKVWVRNMLDGWAGVTFCTAGRENYWIGTTIENQGVLPARMAALRQIPARVCFVSIEPMLGPVTLTEEFRIGGWESKNGGLTERWKPSIHWVICGGESGPKARPMHPDWARSLRDQCAAAGVPFFFKQWGEWTPGECLSRGGRLQCATFDGDYWEYFTQTDKQSEDCHADDSPDVYRVGKHAAGRLLDGREHNEFPIP